MARLKVNGKIIEAVELMIFDRDGTLIDLYAYWSWMIGKRAELIRQRLNLGHEHRLALISAMGIDEENGKIKPEGPVGLKKREIVMQEAVNYLSSIGLRDTSALCVELFKETDEQSLANMGSIIKPINGVFALFDQLAKAPCKIAIATTDKTERARLTMKVLGLTERIAFIVGEDSVKEGKPAPDMINLISKTLKIKRDRTLMVGDAVTDIQMGINADCKASIAVCSGLAGRSALSGLTPYVIEDVSKIQVE